MADRTKELEDKINICNAEIARLTAENIELEKEIEGYRDQVGLLTNNNLKAVKAKCDQQAILLQQNIAALTKT